MEGGKRVVIIKTLTWCLVLQAIAMTGNANSDSGPDEEVEFKISVKNEMKGMKSTDVVYHCKSPEKDLGWHRAPLPGSSFSWNFKVPSYGKGAVTHRCQFRSAQGTADVDIETLSMTATLCGGHVCKYEVRQGGVYFIGNEVYRPNNLFGKFIEMTRPVQKRIQPWTPWSPQQIAALRSRQRRSGGSDGGASESQWMISQKT